MELKRNPVGRPKKPKKLGRPKKKKPVGRPKKRKPSGPKPQQGTLPTDTEAWDYDEELDEGKVAHLKGRIGKPRRGSQTADCVSVRIDAETRAALEREFGSLGNALYYLGEGVQRFRISKNLNPIKEPTDTNAITLDRFEMERCLVALRHWALYKTRDGRHARPYLRTADKIFDFLFGNLEKNKK